MDLLSSIRKTGSRGGVNFSWDEVATSQHRENYLGHSLMAPVGRWQKGRDLNWYAKADADEEEKKARERKDEIRRVKEAEEDALARALGRPVPDRTGGAGGTGANAVSVGEVNRMVKDSGVGDDEDKGQGFGDFVGQVKEGPEVQEGTGDLARSEPTRPRRDARSRSRDRERKHRRHRHRSRSGERRRHRSRSGERRPHSRSRERYRHGHRRDVRDRSRSLSVERRARRYRSRSPDRHRRRTEDDDRGRYSDHRPRRSRSPDVRERDRRGRGFHRRD